MKTIPGICSHHPFFPRKHYPLIDIDGKDPPSKAAIITWLDLLTLKPFDSRFPATIEETPHGWHVYIWKAVSITKAEKLLNSCPYIDKTYARLGRKRGFWFLRTVQMFDPPVPVTYMAIRGGNWYKRKAD